MSTTTVYAPVSTFSGPSAGVLFADGVAVVDSGEVSALRYFAKKGYRIVVEAPEAKPEPEPPAPEAEPAVPRLAQPTKSASKAAWVAFAIAQGADPDEAASLKRDTLAEQYRY